MIGVLAKVGGLALGFLGRSVGVHLFQNHFAGLGIGTLQILVEGLGWRFVAGTAFSLYLSNDKFRAGIDAAIRAIF